jgi:hypothetical protein
MSEAVVGESGEHEGAIGVDLGVGAMTSRANST